MHGVEAQSRASGIFTCTHLPAKFMNVVVVVMVVLLSLFYHPESGCAQYRVALFLPLKFPFCPLLRILHI